MRPFPTVNQLASPTLDGMPDEDARQNCVPASLAAALAWWSGRSYSPDALHDAVYGQGYVGPQDIRRYLPYAASQGVIIEQYPAVGPVLIDRLAALVAGGYPTIGTIPSQWGTPYPDPLHPSGSTHVVCFYPDPAAAVGTLTAMNPWGGFRQNMPRSWWEPRLCYGAVWRTEPRMGIPQGWTDDGQTLKAPNGVGVQHGFRDYILSSAWDSSDWPLASEYGADPVVLTDPQSGGGTRLDCTYVSLVWTASKGVYRAPVGAEVRGVEQQVIALVAQIKQLQQAAPLDTAAIAALRAALAGG